MDKAALGLMGLVIVIWSLSWVAMKYVGNYVGPIDMVAIRYVFAFVFLALVQRSRGQRLRPTPWLLSFAVALFQSVGFQILVQFALMYGAAGRTSALAYTMPFWILLFSWVMLDEKPQAKHWWGMSVAMVGLFLILEPWKGLGGMFGSALAVLGGVFWGFGATCSRLLFQRHRVDLLNATVWQCFLGMLITVPLSLLVQQQTMVFNWEVLLGLLYLGAIATGAGWLVWMDVLRRVRASVAGMSSLGVPVCAVFFAWVFLDEMPTQFEFAGIALVMAGLLLINRPSKA